MRICSLADLPETEGCEFELPLSPGSPPSEIVVFRRGPTVLAYRNRCPHLGTPLNWTPNHFLDTEAEHIVCATHGALFRIDDGHCVSGPCVGDALEALDVRIENGEVWLAG